MCDAPPDPVVKKARWLVEGTNPDAIGAIRAVGCPKGQTCLSIDVPGQHSLPVGYIVCFRRWIAVWNALAWAFFGAFFTNHTKIPYSELYWFVRDQRYIRQHFSQTHSGTKPGGYQHPVARHFTETGVNGDRNAAGGIVSAG